MTRRKIILKVFNPVISHEAHVASNAIIFPGSVIAPFAYIGPSSVIGIGTKINVRASVHHDSVIGNFCTVSPSATF